MFVKGKNGGECVMPETLARVRSTVFAPTGCAWEIMQPLSLLHMLPSYVGLGRPGSRFLDRVERLKAWMSLRNTSRRAVGAGGYRRGNDGMRDVDEVSGQESRGRVTMSWGKLTMRSI